MKLKQTNQKAITLIALVITIVVLIILAVVAVNLALGQNGLFQKARLANIRHKEAAAEEHLKLQIEELRIEKKGDITLSDLYEYFKDRTDIIIEVINEQVAVLASGVSEPDAAPKSIVVVVAKYPDFNFTIDEKCEITEICGIAKKDWNGETSAPPQLDTITAADVIISPAFTWTDKAGTSTNIGDVDTALTWLYTHLDD